MVRPTKLPVGDRNDVAEHLEVPLLTHSEASTSAESLDPEADPSENPILSRLRARPPRPPIAPPRPRRPPLVEEDKAARAARRRSGSNLIEGPELVPKPAKTKEQLRKEHQLNHLKELAKNTLFPDIWENCPTEKLKGTCKLIELVKLRVDQRLIEQRRLNTKKCVATAPSTPPALANLHQHIESILDRIKNETRRNTLKNDDSPEQKARARCLRRVILSEKNYKAKLQSVETIPATSLIPGQNCSTINGRATRDLQEIYPTRRKLTREKEMLKNRLLAINVLDRRSIKNGFKRRRLSLKSKQEDRDGKAETSQDPEDADNLRSKKKKRNNKPPSLRKEDDWMKNLFVELRTPPDDEDHLDGPAEPRKTKTKNLGTLKPKVQLATRKKSDASTKIYSKKNKNENRTESDIKRETLKNKLNGMIRKILHAEKPKRSTKTTPLASLRNALNLKKEVPAKKQKRRLSKERRFCHTTNFKGKVKRKLKKEKGPFKLRKTSTHSCKKGSTKRKQQRKQVVLALKVPAGFLAVKIPALREILRRPKLSPKGNQQMRSLIIRRQIIKGFLEKYKGSGPPNVFHEFLDITRSILPKKSKEITGANVIADKPKKYTRALPKRSIKKGNIKASITKTKTSKKAESGPKKKKTLLKKEPSNWKKAMKPANAKRAANLKAVEKKPSPISVNGINLAVDRVMDLQSIRECSRIALQIKYRPRKPRLLNANLDLFLKQTEKGMTRLLMKARRNLLRKVLAYGQKMYGHAKETVIRRKKATKRNNSPKFGKRVVLTKSEDIKNQVFVSEAIFPENVSASSETVSSSSFEAEDTPENAGAMVPIVKLNVLQEQQRVAEKIAAEKAEAKKKSEPPKKRLQKRLSLFHLRYLPCTSAQSEPRPADESATQSLPSKSMYSIKRPLLRFEKTLCQKKDLGPVSCERTLLDSASKLLDQKVKICSSARKTKKGLIKQHNERVELKKQLLLEKNKHSRNTLIEEIKRSKLTDDEKAYLEQSKIAKARKEELKLRLIPGTNEKMLTNSTDSTRHVDLPSTVPDAELSAPVKQGHYSEARRFTEGRKKKNVIPRIPFGTKRNDSENRKSVRFFEPLIAGPTLPAEFLTQTRSILQRPRTNVFKESNACSEQKPESEAELTNVSVDLFLEQKSSPEEPQQHESLRSDPSELGENLPRLLAQLPQLPKASEKQKLISKMQEMKRKRVLCKRFTNHVHLEQAKSNKSEMASNSADAHFLKKSFLTDVSTENSLHSIDILQKSLEELDLKQKEQLKTIIEKVRLPLPIGALLNIYKDSNEENFAPCLTLSQRLLKKEPVPDAHQEIPSSAGKPMVAELKVRPRNTRNASFMLKEKTRRLENPSIVRHRLLSLLPVENVNQLVNPLPAALAQESSRSSKRIKKRAVIQISWTKSVAQPSKKMTQILEQESSQYGMLQETCKESGSDFPRIDLSLMIQEKSQLKVEFRTKPETLMAIKNKMSTHNMAVKFTIAIRSNGRTFICIPAPKTTNHAQTGQHLPTVLSNNTISTTPMALNQKPLPPIDRSSNFMMEEVPFPASKNDALLSLMLSMPNNPNVPRGLQYSSMAQSIPASPQFSMEDKFIGHQNQPIRSQESLHREESPVQTNDHGIFKVPFLPPRPGLLKMPKEDVADSKTQSLLRSPPCLPISKSSKRGKSKCAQQKYTVVTTPTQLTEVVSKKSTRRLLKAKQTEEKSTSKRNQQKQRKKFLFCKPSQMAGPVAPFRPYLVNTPTGQSFHIPRVIIENEFMFRAVITENAYSSLSEESKAHLRKFLPEIDDDQDELSFVRAALTRDEARMRGMPVTKLISAFRTGRYSTNPTVEPGNVAYESYIRDYHLQLAKKLFINRGVHRLCQGFEKNFKKLQAYLERAANLRPGRMMGQILLPGIEKRKDQQIRTGERAKQRYDIALKTLKERGSATLPYNEDEIPKRIPLPLLAESLESTIWRKQPKITAKSSKDLDLHQPYKMRTYEEMVLLRKKMQKENPKHLSLKTTGITMSDAYESASLLPMQARIIDQVTTLRKEVREIHRPKDIRRNLTDEDIAAYKKASRRGNRRPAKKDVVAASGNEAESIAIPANPDEALEDPGESSTEKKVSKPRAPNVSTGQCAGDKQQRKFKQPRMATTIQLESSHQKNPA